MNCIWCNKPLTGRQERFCSRNCNRRYYDNKSGRVIQNTVPCVCQYCGVWFYTGDRRNTSYCSIECGYISRTTVKTCVVCGKTERKVFINGRYCSEACKAEGKTITSTCIICGIQFTSQYKREVCFAGECGKVIHRERTRELKEKEHKEKVKTFKCVECGKTVAPEYGSKRRVFCSKECSRKKCGRIGKALRRARKRGGKYESVDPLMILDRDKWKCQNCGVKTPKGLRGTIEDDAPEVDHIIPLAAGGWHVNYNLQCLCRKCNQEKGDTVEGQLILFAGVECNA